MAAKRVYRGWGSIYCILFFVIFSGSLLIMDTGGNQNNTFADSPHVATVFFTAAMSAATVVRQTGNSPHWPISANNKPIDKWHGFARHHFAVDSHACWVVEPNRPLPGHPWIWCMKFPNAFPDRCGEIALVQKGFYLAYIQFGSMLGSPKSMKIADDFYQTVTSAGLSRKVVLMGISRGGLYVYNWAALHPNRVSVIYGDAAVCDFKSWPGGLGKGRGDKGQWRNLIKQYGFKNAAQAIASKNIPIDELVPLAKAGIPLINVVGLADHTVPPAENTFILAARYKKLGGEIIIVCKPGMHHHPHGLEHPGVVVDFIMRHVFPRGIGNAAASLK